MNLRKAASALVCALVVVLAVGVSASAASAPAGKKHPKKTHVVAEKKPKKHAAKKKAAAAPKPVCLIGESPQLGKSCTANPLFAKTICPTFVPWLQAIVPDAQFPDGVDLHGTVFGAVDCYWKVNGETQAFEVGVKSMIGWKDDNGYGKVVSPQQSWANMIAQTIADWKGGDTCSDGTTSMAPRQTTVSGYPAFTQDPCTPYLRERAFVYVRAGAVLYTVMGDSTYVTSSQLIPVVEQLIAKYQQYAPKETGTP